MINPTLSKAIRRIRKCKRAYDLNFLFGCTSIFKALFGWVTLNFINVTISLQFTSYLLLEVSGEGKEDAGNSSSSEIDLAKDTK